MYVLYFPSAASQFLCVHEVKTQADVRLELIQLEKTMLSAGNAFENMSASSFLTAAFDIEDAQCVFLNSSLVMN